MTPMVFERLSRPTSTSLRTRQPPGEAYRPGRSGMHRGGVLMFGCGTASGPLHFDPSFRDATLTERTRDRLERNDEIRRERYQELKESRHFSRRSLLRAGAGATVATALPLVSAQPALADDDDEPRKLPAPPQRRVVTVPSVGGAEGTVVLGQFDTTREPVATVESGDTVSYPKTLTHFLGAIQPGVPI